jgi:hypothetical protein
MFLSKSKVMLAIAAALVVACAGATERKSYSNDRFGFAFDYPASWSLIEQRSSRSGEAVLSVKLLSPDENVPVRRDYSPGSVSIEVFANPARRPLREWLDEHGWPFGPAGRSVTPTSIGGLPALEVATGKMFAPNRFTYVASKDWVLRLSALAPDSEIVVRSIRFDP